MSHKHFHTKRDEMLVFWVPAAKNEVPELRMIACNYAGLQRAVGGYVTPYPLSLIDLPELPCGCDLAVLVDEDGMMKRLEHNDRMNAYLNMRGFQQPILGDALVVAQGPVGKGEYEYWGLPDFMRRWRGPGYPLPVDEGADV